MMRSKFKYIIFCFLILFSILGFNIKTLAAENKVTIYLFHGDGCPHCADEKKFLAKMINKYENIDIKYYEVWYNEENEKLMNFMKEKYNNTRKGVPFTIIGDYSYVGYNTNIAYQIEENIKELLDIGDTNSVQKIMENPDENIDLNKVKEDDGTRVVPILGKIDAKKISLPLLSIVIGFVDGFNPCAMWVLLFLLSILVGMKNKKRALFIGITFLVASASVYLVFMFAWLNLVVSMSNVAIIRTIIAIVALVGSLLNFRSYFKKTEDGCSVTDAKKKRKIFEKIKKFTSEKSFILATIGIITLAISVNVIELACSAGLPILFTQILSFNHLSGFEYGLYIFIYILFFMLDDIIIFLIAMFSMKITGISNKYTKYSHLIGGIIMFIIGILLLFNPSILMFNV